MMRDWKEECDIEAGLRREFSERASKAEAEVERLQAALQLIANYTQERVTKETARRALIADR